MRPQPAPRAADFLLLPILYFAAARLAISFTVMPEGMAILWAPNGVLLAFLIRFHGRGYAVFAASALAAEVAADLPQFSLSEALLFGLNNVAEATLALALLRRWHFDPRFAAPADLLKFVAAGPLVASLAAACLGGWIYTVYRGTETSYFEFLRIWWFGDALGLLIVTPLLLSASQAGVRRFAGTPRLGLAGMATGAGGLIAAGLLLAARGGMLGGIHVGPVLLLPFAIFAAARSSVAGAATIVAGIALLILHLTTGGYNPFGRDDARAAVIFAQEFLAITSVTMLGLAALMTQLRVSRHDLERAHDELRSRAEALERANAELRRSEAEVTALNDELEARVRTRTRELEQALSQVKQLTGLLPICAWCKKVRDDEDYWHSVEEYITERTDAQFTHSICPSCVATVYDQNGLTR